MNLPSFLWLWKIAAWSMGLSLLAYVMLATTGFWMYKARNLQQPPSLPMFQRGLGRMRSLHFTMGITMVSLVLLLLAIGIIGTLGHFGSLGHSSHLVAGLLVVVLVLLSAFSATQISPERPWVRNLHVTLNIILFIGFAWVSLTGWIVVQKYLP
ncbi:MULTISPECIES: DUF4079 domain-containing protein [Calothrix]|uniref:DUF4079 domain-containing protein n=2 Tax=Calothrix TaxID=1186 RepID=A0ABR8A9X1_9CYAN|nr:MULTISPECIES: DUF4079 domain-containing protein [Calothrix]MBD2196073.1 DUF4079 domain-containing protein [Calothrix parietina FACHB-288]MBD2224723.1 DUF4079 domain-containing protein [Calothrix anomala FACHB-343]